MKLDALSSLDELAAALDERNMTPGWMRRQKPILYPEMRSQFVPMLWRYEDAKAAMKSAGRLIDTELAERRNFVLRNPSPGNDYATLRTLVCAYQSILPGEKARSHRHAPHALRVILESRGSYSVVNGHKHPMESGDIVLTPGWSWHGHGHDGAEQAYWFDGLDVPLTHLLEPMFFEEHPQGFEPVTVTDPVSPMRFTWDSVKSQLDTAPGDDVCGRTVELPAPTMPTLKLRVHAWPAGWRNTPYRHTANVVHVVMRGEGSSVIEGQRFDWRFGDALAIPAWSRIEHHADSDAVLFNMSDEALMRWTRYYRFEALS